MSTLLLPPAAGAGAAGSDGWESEADDWERSCSEGGTSEGEWQEGQCQAAGDGFAAGSSNAALRAGAPTDGGPSSPAARPPPFSLALLSFRSAQQEAAFASFHARHMQRADCCAYLICAALFW